MISLEAFARAIQHAIISANEALMDKNLNILDRYFESVGDEEALQQSLDDALQATKDITEKDDIADRETMAQAYQALYNAKEALAPEGEPSAKRKKASASFEEMALKAQIPDTLRPKTVVVHYPIHTSSGIEMKEVHVPLITLVPISMSQISEVKLNTDLEIQLVDDEVQVSFSNRTAGKKKGLFEKEPKTTLGHLEITIKPHEGSEGLRRLVEGYEKVLRSQIPG